MASAQSNPRLRLLMPFNGLTMTGRARDGNRTLISFIGNKDLCVFLRCLWERLGHISVLGSILYDPL